jgi:hypothetical protein
MTFDIGLSNYKKHSVWVTLHFETKTTHIVFRSMDKALTYIAKEFKKEKKLQRRGQS